MSRVGFEAKWTNLIMRCISSISYSVLVNGKIEERFYPTRGLRQGDPLSPFLFLIYSKSLLTLMSLVIGQGLIRGAKASRGGPPISHLFICR